MNGLSTAAFVVALGLSTGTLAGPVEDLSGVLNGRQGGASEDRRGSTKLFPGGPQIDCPGDTLEANVRITGVSGALQGDNAIMTVDYTGEYTRQGWGGGCNRLPGAENGKISGKYSFTVTGKAFQKPVITWGSPRNLGTISTDPNHDSNVFAVRAVQAAIGSAF
jgi:hypothetical protein